MHTPRTEECDLEAQVGKSRGEHVFVYGGLGIGPPHKGSK